MSRISLMNLAVTCLFLISFSTAKNTPHLRHDNVALSPSAAHPSCLTLESIPKDVFDIIAKFSSIPDMTNLASVNTILHEACQDALKYRFKMEYVGETPTFIPAMKRCMMKDDVQCYHLVLKHYSAQNEENPWRLNQLPALAAQLGAYKIFKQLDISNRDPRWNSSLTRAYTRNRIAFVNQFTRSPFRISLDPAPPTVPEFYRLNHNQNASILARNESIIQPSSFDYLRLPEELTKLLDRNQYDWIDVSMAKTDPYPNVTHVFNVLTTEDIAERSIKIQELQRQIVSTLKKGVYLLDDIMESSANIQILWWNFGRTEPGQKDGGRSAFIHWLIDEGAPMDVTDWIELYMKRRESNPKTSALYLESIKLSDRYVSASGTGSFIAALDRYVGRALLSSRSSYHYNLATMLEITPFFKKYLDADLYDPYAMVLMIRFLSAEASIRPVGIEKYVKLGLSMPQLEIVKLYLKSNKDEFYRYQSERESMLRFVSQLESALKKHEMEVSPLHEKPSKLLSLWIHLQSMKLG